MGVTMDGIAAQVRSALASQDASASAELLDPNVTWGAPGSRKPTCRNRKQVLQWYQESQEAGVRGRVFDVEVLGDRLLVSISVNGTDEARERGGTALRYQVLTISNGRIADIVGFDNKADALANERWLRREAGRSARSTRDGTRPRGPWRGVAGRPSFFVRVKWTRSRLYQANPHGEVQAFHAAGADASGSGRPVIVRLSMPRQRGRGVAPVLVPVLVELDELRVVHPTSPCDLEDAWR